MRSNGEPHIFSICDPLSQVFIAAKIMSNAFHSTGSIHCAVVLQIKLLQSLRKAQKAPMRMKYDNPKLKEDDPLQQLYSVEVKNP